MKQRGRRSAARLELVPSNPSVLDRCERVKPPAFLTNEHVEIWWEVANGKEADWFSGEHVSQLTQYCRHVVETNRLDDLVERMVSAVDPDTNLPTLSMADYERLLRMRRDESKMVFHWATKLRITPHSLTNHRGNKKTKTTHNPWEGY